MNQISPNKQNRLTMKKFIYSSLLLLFFSSCGSFHLADHHNLEMNEKLLPSLQPVYHFYDGNPDNMQTVYYDEGYQETDVVFARINPYFDPFLEGLFRKEVWGAISKSGTKDFGYAVLKENYLSVANNFAFAALGASFAFIPNLLGLPLNIQEVEIEYVLEIIDSNDKLIGRYIGSGYSKKVFGVYNYGEGGNGKLLKLHAYEEAMEKIKGQITKDYSELSANLLLAGPID